MCPVLARSLYGLAAQHTLRANGGGYFDPTLRLVTALVGGFDVSRPSGANPLGNAHHIGCGMGRFRGFRVEPETVLPEPKRSVKHVTAVRTLYGRCPAFLPKGWSVDA